jgi:hypothetical protein
MLATAKEIAHELSRCIRHDLKDTLESVAQRWLDAHTGQWLSAFPDPIGACQTAPILVSFTIEVTEPGATFCATKVSYLWLVADNEAGVPAKTGSPGLERDKLVVTTGTDTTQ